MKRIFNILLVIFATITIVSCTTTKYVPVEVPKIEKEYIHQVDTTYIIDSLVEYIHTKTDSVIIERTKWRYEYKVKCDTIHSVDSIYVSYPVEVEKIVTKHSWYEEYLWTALGLLLFVIIGYMVIKRIC